MASQSEGYGMQGSNTTAAYSPQAKAQREFAIQQALPGALTNDQFFICLQPRFEMPARRIVGAEALLRWNMPEGGILFPGEFLPAAARTQLQMPLDLFALGQACTLIASLQAAGQHMAPISINVSLSSLHTPGYISLAIDMLKRGCIPHNMIEFEFAAADALLQTNLVLQAVNQLRGMHCSCSVQGFCGKIEDIPRLTRLGVDSIKVNCRYYAPGNEPEGIQACVSAYHTIEELGVTAVCEGVEFQEQLQTLLEEGCTLLQGYALSMPVPMGIYTKMLQRYG